MDPLQTRGLSLIVLVFGVGLLIGSLGYLLWRANSRRQSNGNDQHEETTGTTPSAAETEEDTITADTDTATDTGGFVFGDERTETSENDSSDSSGRRGG